MVVVVVKRRAACKQKRDVIVNGKPYYDNSVVVVQELAMVEQGVGVDNNDAHSCQGVGNNQQGNDEDLLNFHVGYNPYEVVDRKVFSKNIMTIIDMLHAGMENRLTKSVHTFIIISSFLYSVI